MTRRGNSLRPVVLALVGSLPIAAAHAANIEIKEQDGGARITIDGEPFCEYVFKSGHQPIIWPIVGPNGKEMTRQFPMRDKLPTEQDDHPHHRSLWFNHGEVNGKDFWREPGNAPGPGQDNQIEHRDLTKLESGEVATLVATNDWNSDGQKICEDERTIRFGADEHGRWIDFAVEVRASEGELKLSGNKEGSFGVRVPGTLDVDAKVGGKIVSSRGLTNEAAWGRAAEWVDYHGLVDDKPAGIVIFDMPDSFRHPAKWHVRTYGLFAANPFAQDEFPKSDDPEQGDARLAKDETMRCHYRVLFYDGERAPEELERIFKEYSESARSLNR